MDRLHIQTLREAGHTLEQVAELVGVSKRSVQTIVQELPVTSLDDAPTPKSRGVGRPSKVEAFRSAVSEILSDEPSLPTVEVLCRLRSLGYEGGKSALCDLLRRLRPKRPEPPMVRFEGLAGEFSQHDFGSVKVTYADGMAETIRFFASRLKFSRWADVRLVADHAAAAEPEGLGGESGGVGEGELLQGPPLPRPR